jgi:hypothetical protein
MGLLLANVELLGDLLLRSLLKALAMKEKHSDVLKKFNAILPEDLRQEWQEMISQWEQDKKKPNPYTHTEKGSCLLFCRFTTSC